LKKREDIVLGRRELIQLLDFELTNIVAKIDTGAYSTSIHCKDIFVEKDKSNNQSILYFTLPKKKYKLTNDKEISTTNFTRKKVVSSSGHSELRYIIKTKIKIGIRTVTTDVSLADRTNLKYPILIGRKLLAKGFIVDVRKINQTIKNI
jgi:hypothetical protein